MKAETNHTKQTITDMYQNREELAQLCIQFLLGQTANAQHLDTKFEADDHAFLAVSGMDGYFIVLAETHGDATDPEPNPEGALAWLRTSEAVKDAAAYALAKGGFLRYQLLGIGTDENGQAQVKGMGASPKLEWLQVFPDVDTVHEDLKSKVETATAQVEGGTDLRAAVETVRQLREQLKTATLLKDQRDELFGQLNKTSDVLREKLEVERAETEAQSQSEFDRFNPQVDEWITKVQEITEFKPAREAMIALQNEVKGTRMTREHKSLLFDKLDIAFKVLRQRQDEDWKAYEAECEANLNRFTQTLTEVSQNLETATEFRPIRDQLIAVQQEIREAKLFREKRQALYEQLDGLFAKLREKQDADRDQFESKSGANYEQCKAWAEEVLQIVNGTGDGDNYAEAKQKVKEILNKVYEIAPMRMKQKREIIGIIKEAEDRLYTNAKAFYERVKQERENRSKERAYREQNWKQRLQGKINRLEDTISRIENGIEKDKDYLDEIQTKLEYVFKGKSVGDLKATYEERTVQIKNRIAENRERILDIQREIKELRERLKNEKEGEKEDRDDD